MEIHSPLPLVKQFLNVRKLFLAWQHVCCRRSISPRKFLHCCHWRSNFKMLGSCFLLGNTFAVGGPYHHANSFTAATGEAILNVRKLFLAWQQVFYRRSISAWKFIYCCHWRNNFKMLGSCFLLGNMFAVGGPFHHANSFTVATGEAILKC